MAEDTICRSRILLVDAEEWVREFFTSVIKLCGYEEFTLVNSVTEALEAIAQCPYDLIITDLKQPQYQRLMEHVQAHHPGTRFIIMVQPWQQFENAMSSNECPLQIFRLRLILVPRISNELECTSAGISEICSKILKWL